MLLNWFASNSTVKHCRNIAISYAFKFDENIIAIWTFYFPDLLQCVQEPQAPVLSPQTSF